MSDKTILDHINPTEREAALIEQYNKALATVASVAKERDRLQAELSAFHAAMERERKPDWEKWHKDLADALDYRANYNGPSNQATRDTLRTAARELRYMADSFTLKANFVPTELKIKELEAESDAANRDAKATIISLNEVSKFAAESILKLTNERDEFHRCLLAREGTLKADGDRWVKAMTERDEARAALQHAQADGAAMRQMLNTVYEWCVSDNPSDIDGDEVEKVIDGTESGKALLARLEEARAKLEDLASYAVTVRLDRKHEEFQLQTEDWCVRLMDKAREAYAWLNPKEGK